MGHYDTGTSLPLLRTRRLATYSFAFTFLVSSYVFWTAYTTLPPSHVRSVNGFRADQDAVPQIRYTRHHHHILSDPKLVEFQDRPVIPEIEIPLTIAEPSNIVIDDSSSERGPDIPIEPDVTAVPHISTAVVLGRLQEEAEKSQWIHRLTDVDRKAVYIVDDHGSELHLRKNHGRESMVYLRYIMDHYDNLTDVTIFMHSHEEAWHNNVLLRKNATETINRLNRDFVLKQRYFNTRCDLYPGCPDWIHVNPSKEEHEEDPTRIMDAFTTQLWEKLFPGADHVPQFIAAPCCSQFAASREAIRSVPYETFVRLHDWLATEDLDLFSGRIMEMLWHYIFTGKDQLCPATASCYCEAYGVCFENDGSLDQFTDAQWNEGRTGAQLEAYDRKLRGHLTGQEAEVIVGKDPEHLRLVKATKEGRKHRMDVEGQLRSLHAVKAGVT